MASEKNKTNWVTQLVYWVIGATALVGAVFLFWPKEDPHTKLTGNLKLSNDSMKIVDSYLQWADGASKNSMDLSHEFAANGLMKMAEALQVLSSKVSKKVGDDAKYRIDTIKEMSNYIVQNSKSSEHAGMVKKAFISSEEVLTSVQTYSFPELKEEIEILNKRVSEIKADHLMLEQKEEIVGVFDQVAVILTRMTSDENKKLN